MHSKVFFKTYLPTPVDEKEVLRYAGWRGELDEPTRARLNACIRDNEDAFSCRVCYIVLPAQTLLDRWQDGGQLLFNRLKNAEYALIFAATVGLEIDRRILKAETSSPTDALFLQALGAERIESVCDTFCADMQKACKEKGYFVGKRFSAGYGDFPLEKQIDMFALLPCDKIGLTLNSSLLMSPSKSVTAILPIGKEENCIHDGCNGCKKIDCQLRK